MSKLICIASYIIFAALLITFPLRRKKWAAQAGNPIQKGKASFSKLVFAISIVSPIIITLILLRSLGLMIDFVLCACALLGEELMLKDTLVRLMEGLYQNALIIDGKYILIENIISLPTLAYEESADTNSLKIVTQKEGEIFINFHSSEERNTIVSKLLEIAPRLKP